MKAKDDDSERGGACYHYGRKKRGVAFIGGEGPEPDLGRRLAAGAEVVVAADGGLLAAEAAGVVPDWVVGDMDSLGDLGRLAAYPPERVRRFPPDKDDTDTELALGLLWDAGCEETWLIGGGGGRLDHLLALRALFERPRAPDRWFTADAAVCLLPPGGVLTLRLSPGALVSVFPAGEALPGGAVWAAESAGLKWPLGGVRWTRGSAGVSNVAVEGEFTARSREGRFLVVVPLGAATHVAQLGNPQSRASGPAGSPSRVSPSGGH